MARIVAEKLSAALGQQVDRRQPRRRLGLVGTRALHQGPPDGYTLFLGHTGSISINPSLYANAGFDPRKDFAADRADRLDAGRADRESVVSGEDGRRVDRAAMKANPGKLNIGTSAAGTGGYLSAELFKSVAGVERDRPLQGHRRADQRPARRPRAGRLRGAAAGAWQHPGRHAARDRGAQRPALSPVARRADRDRVGLPGFESALHYGLLAPAGMPRPIVDHLNNELRKLVDSEEVRKRIHSEGGDPLTSTPDEYAADIDKEETKWSALIRKLNLKVE